MPNWSVLIIPLVVLAIVLLLPFAGCGLDEEGGKEEPATVEKKEIPIKLSWNGPADHIRAISFGATAEEANANGIPTGTGAVFQGLGVSPAAWPPQYLKSSGNTSVTATVDAPFAPKYWVTATVTVKVGAWGTGDATEFPTPLSKPFTIDEDWAFALNFSLATQMWELA